MIDPLKQSLRNGRYAVMRVLGEGAQATTFEAVDKRDGVPVAIKRFRVRGATSWKEVELAEREARVLASLSEPSGAARGKPGAGAASSGVGGGGGGGRAQPSMPSNLPRYIEHFEEDGELYLVTEMIEGESLLALRKRGAHFSEADVARLLRDASAALDFLHGRSPPVIHRDIKPSNVLRRPDGSFAFIDFGSVRDRLKPEGGSTVVGTFGYMAPEQFQGRAMPASDVYSLGATAISMLAGVEPEALPHKGLAIDVPAALKRASASPAMIAMLSAMLDPDPDRRAARVEPLLASYQATSRSARPGPAWPGPAWPAPGQPTRPGERGADPARGRSSQAQERARDASRPRDAKREKKRARKEARREERRSRDDAQSATPSAAPYSSSAMQVDRSARPRGPFFPPPLVPFLLIGLTIAQVAVTLALGVLVPVLFAILSIVFGKGLRDAGQTTRNAGKIAVESMSHAKDVVRGVTRDDGGFGVRVHDDAARAGYGAQPQRVRIDGAAGAAWTDDLEREIDKVKRAAEEEQAAREAAEDEQAAREAARADEKKKKKSRDRRG